MKLFNFCDRYGLVLAIYNTHINTMYVMNIKCNLFLIDYDSRLCNRQNPIFVINIKIVFLWKIIEPCLCYGPQNDSSPRERTSQTTNVLIHLQKNLVTMLACPPHHLLVILSVSCKFSSWTLPRKYCVIVCWYAFIN